jgi:hypothetical protein
MDPVKQRAVQEAELFLETFLKELKILEDKVRASKNPEKRVLRHELEARRIRFSHMMSGVVLFKAKFGIVTNLKRLN